MPPDQLLTFQRAQPAGESPLELDVELRDLDGAGEIQGDPLARALQPGTTPGLGDGAESGGFTVRTAPVPLSGCPQPRPPTWSEFQHVSSLASNMCFFPNCFTSRLSTELTLRGDAPPSQGRDGDSVSVGTRVPHRAREQGGWPQHPAVPSEAGLTAWPCRRRPAAPRASLPAATSLRRDGVSKGQQWGPPAALGTPEQQ